MTRRSVLITCGVIAAAAGGISSIATAKTEEWKDTQGNRFRGEPVEVIGPLALFRTSRTAGRRMPLHLLTPEGCVRFYEKIRTEPARVDDWTQAKSVISQELLGKVLRVQDDRLIPADLKGRPEPEFFILFFASNSIGQSWEMMGRSTPLLYSKIQQDHPGMVEALFYGLRHSRREHIAMAVGTKMSWLVADPYEESKMDAINRLAPGDGYGMMIVSRSGVPLLSSAADSEAAVKQTLNQLTELLDLMRPDDARAWNDRAYYLRAVQPVAYAKGHSPPLLVGVPLKTDALKQAGISRFDATIEVAADGIVTKVRVKPDAALPPEMAGPISDALQEAVFVPAVKNGKFVADVYEYHFELPH